MDERWQARLNTDESTRARSSTHEHGSIYEGRGEEEEERRKERGTTESGWGCVRTDAGRVRTGAGGYNECRAMKITRYVIAKYNYYLLDLCFKVERGVDESNISGFKSCCSSPSPCPSITTTRTTAAVARTAAVRLPPPRSSPSASTTRAAAAAARIAAAHLSWLKFECQRWKQ